MLPVARLLLTGVGVASAALALVFTVLLALSAWGPTAYAQDATYELISLESVGGRNFELQGWVRFPEVDRLLNLPGWNVPVYRNTRGELLDRFIVYMPPESARRSAAWDIELEWVDPTGRVQRRYRRQVSSSHPLATDSLSLTIFYDRELRPTRFRPEFTIRAEGWARR